MDYKLVVWLIFTISFLIEIMYLKTLNKNHFLTSIFLICAGSIIIFLSHPNLDQTIFFMIAIITSLIGDILMAERFKITGERIIDGIMAFAVAHIFYILAFNHISTNDFELWYVLTSFIILLGIYFLVIYNPLVKRIIKIGSIFYTILIISLFVIVLRFAIEWSPNNVSFIALVGIIMFILSDSIIAFNEFKQEFRYAEQFISFTYVLAQILLQSTQLLIL